jgi:chromosome segregation ATPase
MEEKSDEQGFLGKIGAAVEDLIFEKPAEADEVKAAETPGATPSPDSGSAPQKETASVPQKTNTPVNPKIFEKLKSAVDGKVNAFSQFNEMLASLSDVIADEAMRYAAAMKAVGKSYSITADQIIRAMDVKLGALEEEKKKFSGTIKQSEEELAGFHSQLTQKDQAIQSLRNQIGMIEAEKQDVERIMNEKKGKIEAVRRDFSAAADALKVEMEQQKEIMVKYLKGGKQ